MDYSTEDFFTDEIETNYASNDCSLDCKSPEEQAKFFDADYEIVSLLKSFHDREIGHLIVRGPWADALLRPLLPANPYRNPVDIVQIRQDIAFLYFLSDRIEKIQEQLCKAVDQHRAASDDVAET